jgi:hypothetical protein
MIRSALLCAGLLVSSARADPDPAPAVAVSEVPCPSARGASGASIARGPDGRAWLSWIESGPGDQHALKFSTMDANAATWSAARTIATGSGWFINWADFPALAVGRDGHATAVWFVNNPQSHGAMAHDHGSGYHAMISSTADAGATWSPPARLTRESDAVEFVSLAALADGRTLAVWLDGRGRHAGGKAQQLFARIIGGSSPIRWSIPGSATAARPRWSRCLTAAPWPAIAAAPRRRFATSGRPVTTAAAGRRLGR